MQALRQVDILKKQLDELLPMKEEYKRELDKKIRLEFNYNSNHLEGNTFTYGETKLLLLFGQTSAGKTIRDTEEMKAHDVAYKMITDWAADKEYVLTERDIKDLNRIILVEPFKKATKTPDGQPSSRIINIGDYKQQSNSVETATGEIFEFASPIETPAKMGDLMQWYRGEEGKGEFDAVSLAALFHYRFVRIHPFDDGNGRISRLLMNYILLKNGYPPVVIKSADKHNYLAALRMADADDIEAFVQYIAEQLQWSLELYIKAAKGESVDEPGDLDKKLAALKKKLNSTKEVTVEKNTAILYTRINDSVYPFFNILLRQLGQFDSLFKSKTLAFDYHGFNYEGHPRTESTSSLEDAIQELAFFEDIVFFRANYILSDFRATSKKEVIKINFIVKFYNIIYEFSCADASIKFDKMYDEIIGVEESNTIAEKIGNAFYKQLEAIVDNN